MAGAAASPRVGLRQRLKEVQLRRLPHYAREAARRFAPKALTPMVGPNVWGPRLPGIEGLLKDLELLEVCALQWRTCVELTRGVRPVAADGPLP